MITCLGCGYDLQALPTDKCPECGRRFDPDDPDAVGHPDTKVKPWLLIVSAVGVCLVILCPLAAYLLSVRSAVDFFDAERGSEAFYSDEWKDQGNLGDTYRWSAVDDLLAKHQLVGMHKNEVIALLGRPDEGPYFDEASLDYYLAPDLVDCYWLVLDLDEAGVVTRTYETTD